MLLLGRLTVLCLPEGSTSRVDVVHGTTATTPTAPTEAAGTDVAQPTPEHGSQPTTCRAIWARLLAENLAFLWPFTRDHFGKIATLRLQLPSWAGRAWYTLAAIGVAVRRWRLHRKRALLRRRDGSTLSGQHDGL